LKTFFCICDIWRLDRPSGFDSLFLCQLLKRNEATDDGGSVSYDYSYKQWSERDVTAHDSSHYRWTTTTWSPCNATCGRGTLPTFIDSL